MTTVTNLSRDTSIIFDEEPVVVLRRLALAHYELAR